MRGLYQAVEAINEEIYEHNKDVADRGYTLTYLTDGLSETAVISEMHLYGDYDESQEKYTEAEILAQEVCKYAFYWLQVAEMLMETGMTGEGFERA